jgi:4'-phosphopantetheinyl transferase
LSLQILDSEIHLWYVTKSDFSLQELQQYCLAWLSEKERSRYARYYFDDSRKQLLLGRFLTRSVLSQYRDEIDPGDWRFVENEFGKPALHPEHNSLPLYFNLSHSADRAVLAVARFEAIGVDIERSDKQRRVAKIADRFFSAGEVSSLLKLPDIEQLPRFYDLWTLKEAYIKAWGQGLAIPLDHFGYAFDGQRIEISFSALREDDPRHWQLWQMGLAEDYKLALALRTKSDNRITTISSWTLTSFDDFQSRDSVIMRRN